MSKERAELLKQLKKEKFVEDERFFSNIEMKSLNYWVTGRYQVPAWTKARQNPSPILWVSEFE